MKGINCLIAFLVILLVGCTKEKPVLIRIKNTSNFTYKNITVEAGTTSNSYGTLSSNQFSEYKTFDVAYRYAFVELSIDSVVYTIQPIDFVGETPLEGGNYTYEISAKDTGTRYDKLSLTFKKD